MWGTGLLSRFERGLLKRDLGKFPERVWAYIPRATECTSCGFDPFSQSGLDPSCATCNGTGRIMNWAMAQIACRISWVDRQRIGVEYWKGVAVGETGEVIIGAPLRDRALLEQVLETPEAYLMVSGRRVRPFAIVPNRVEGETTLDVRCNISTEARASA